MAAGLISSRLSQNNVDFTGIEVKKNTRRFPFYPLTTRDYGDDLMRLYVGRTRIEASLAVYLSINLKPSESIGLFTLVT